MAKHEKYPPKLIAMLMDRGDKSIADILPKIHKYFPKFKKRLTPIRAQALSSWYKGQGWYKKNKKGTKSRNGSKAKKNGVLKFIDMGKRKQKEILAAGLLLNKEGNKTPATVRDHLSDQFKNIIIPPALQLKRLIARFAKDGTVPGKGNGETSTNGKFPFRIEVKGPGTEFRRGVPEELANEIIQKILPLATGD